LYELLIYMVPPAGDHRMLPDRSRTISASGATDVANTASSPVGGVTANATPGRDAAQIIKHVRKTNIFAVFI
jgi:hypothetical protein